MTMVGAPERPLAVPVIPLLFKRRRFAGSIIGGLRETQEMLDFCGEHGITADIETIAIHDVNDAYARLQRGEVMARRRPCAMPRGRPRSCAAACRRYQA